MRGHPAGSRAGALGGAGGEGADQGGGAAQAGGAGRLRGHRDTAAGAVRSAADIPGLHRPWTAALAVGVLEIVGDRAAASPELDGWPGEGDTGGRWLAALRAVCGEITGGAADDSLGLLVLALPLLRSLSAGIRLSSHEVIDAAHSVADERGLWLMQVHVLGGMSALSRGLLADEVGSLLGLLAEFGAVTAGREPAVTPLGEWAMERLEADLPRAVSPGATATEAIAVVAVARASDRWHMAQGWLCARKPADAVGSCWRRPTRCSRGCVMPPPRWPR
jgi:hypothetical protein